ncbi:MAG TPA: hypothetical protein VGH66_01400, partial [Acidimicrobiales bacterium]
MSAEQGSGRGRNTSGGAGPAPSRYTQHNTLWLTWATGRGVDPAGRPVALGPRLPVKELVSRAVAAGADHVMVCGPPPAAAGVKGTPAELLRTWASAELPEGWTPGTFHVPPAWATTRLQFKPSTTTSSGGGSGRPQHSRALSLTLAAAWWDGGDVDPAAGRAALGELERGLAGRFPFGASPFVLNTPVATGLELMCRLPDRKGVDWTPWPAEARALVRANAGQHRMEWVAAGVELPQVVELDMHTAYAALCREIGAGPPIIDGGPFEFAAMARYRARWDIPAGWPTR